MQGCTLQEGSLGRSPLIELSVVLGGARRQGRGENLRVMSPVTGEQLASGPAAGSDDIEEALALAVGALPGLRRLGRDRRCDLLQGVADELAGDEARLSELLTLEQGKPLPQAREEVADAIRMLRHTAEEGRRLADAPPILADTTKRAMLIREAIGVVASITPWNFPLAIPIEHLAPALAMGNAVVFKPAETTALTGVALCDAFLAAGWPPGALACLSGGGAVGAELAAHPDVDMICFTGSSETGHIVAGVGAGKELLLELGGNGPTIVFADADLDRAAEGIASACFYAAGQSCAATERILVEEGVLDDLTIRLAKQAEQTAVGDPREEATALGPLHTAELAAKVDRHVQGAQAAGATVICGGRIDPSRPTPLYFPATVVSGVPPDCELFREETFGPVAALTPFRDETEALRLAELGSYGLVASIWTRDLPRALRLADAVPNGNVNINEHSNYWELSLPFGGAPRRSSGVGRIGGEETLRRMSTIRTIVIDSRG